MTISDLIKKYETATRIEGHMNHQRVLIYKTFLKDLRALKKAYDKPVDLFGEEK